MTYAEKYSELEGKLRRLKKAKLSLVRSWAAACSPYSRGQIMQVPNGAVAHAGKQVKVMSCMAREDGFDGSFRWEILGKVLCKDGRPARDGRSYAQFTMPMTKEHATMIIENE